MVMDLLGPSLEDLFDYCGRKFSLKTTLMLVDQMLARIEYIHSRNMLHRDIKPDNFVIGRRRNKSGLVYIIDMGLAKKYRHSKTHAHIPYATGRSLTGTARYASINSHAGVEQSRRDDLESLGYVFIYFLLGKLPWQGIPASNRDEKYKLIWKRKENTDLSTLCKDIPDVFAKYLEYCRSLSFASQPDYGHVRRLFRTLFFESGFSMDGEYDWMEKKSSSSSQRPTTSNNNKKSPRHNTSSSSKAQLTSTTTIATSQKSKNKNLARTPPTARSQLDRQQAALKEFYNRGRASPSFRKPVGGGKRPSVSPRHSHGHSGPGTARSPRSSLHRTSPRHSSLIRPRVNSGSTILPRTIKPSATITTTRTGNGPHAQSRGGALAPLTFRSTAGGTGGAGSGGKQTSPVNMNPLSKESKSSLSSSSRMMYQSKSSSLGRFPSSRNK